MKSATTGVNAIDASSRRIDWSGRSLWKVGVGLLAAIALNLSAAPAASAAWTEMVIPAELQPSVSRMRICKRWFDGGAYGKFWELHLQTFRNNADAQRVDVTIFLRDGRFARRYSTSAWLPPPSNVSLVIALASIDLKETFTASVRYLDARDVIRTAFATVPRESQGNLALCAF